MKLPGAERFSPEWLALRAPYDDRSRDESLLPLLAEALGRGDGQIALTDLGSGTGSNFLYLAGKLARLVPVDQKWRLVDRDERLLDRAAARIGEQARANGWDVRVEGEQIIVHVEAIRWTISLCRLDLARELEVLRLGEGEAVVLSAVADLVSPAWLQTFVDWARAAHSPILANLTYDGQIDWNPPDRDDARVRALFNDHQRRDKGFGPALGPSAPGWMAARLLAAGYTVEQRPSPWRIGPSDVAMHQMLIQGVSDSAAEQDPQARRLVEAWAVRRSTQADLGVLSAAVGHVDVLARP